MSSKLFCIVLVILSAVAMSSAQDPTKVESSHYKVAFENASVQVVNVYYGPHEKSGMHDHPGGVVVIITGGHLRFTDEHGKVQEVYSKDGDSRWFPPFRHKVENLGDTPYRAVYVGLKSKSMASGTGIDPANNRPEIDAQTGKIIADILLASHAK